MAATRLALEDAKLAITLQISEQIGVAYGTSLAGVADLATEMFRGFGGAGVYGIPAATVIEYPPHLAAGQVAAEFRIYGPAMTVSTNCCTGLDAISDVRVVLRLRRPQ